MSRSYAWWNGTILPANEILISPFDRGLLYGDGLFETLRADDETIWHLDRHLDRLNQSAGALNFDVEAFPDWGSVILSLISKNCLAGPIRIKILVTRGRLSVLGLPQPAAQTMMVTTINFTPPSEEQIRRGIEGRISRDWQTPQLAMHKTCNYLPYLCANEEVSAAGGEIALLKDRDGFISEATTAALLFTRGSTFCFPRSHWQLPSTTAEVLLERLQENNHSVESAPIREDDVPSFDGCWVLSSSLGARPVNLPEFDTVRDDRVELTEMFNSLIFQ